MDDALYTLDRPQNEPVHHYAPGSPEKKELKKELQRIAGREIEIPLIIGGKEIKTGDLGEVVMPHDHGHVLARFHRAGEKEVEMAIEAAEAAWPKWSKTRWAERISVFLKAAELLAGPWRMTLNAATILGQSKTPFQAEIDSACELIDFFRFNSYFVDQIYSQQPASTLGNWDRFEWRPLEGFILAITPFNFTSIAGNLPSAPAMMGNTVLWKPSDTALLSGYYLMRLFETAGIPPGVINFIPGDGPRVGKAAISDVRLGGIHFTGSTATFQAIWQQVGENITRYHSYPRVVGETGGKDFIFAHPSADVKALGCALVRGAFEYQGQKCSAASRAYIPESLWTRVKKCLRLNLRTVKMGDPADFRNFMSAIIDRRAFDKITGYIKLAREDPNYEILFGGQANADRGYFIEPTVVLSQQPDSRLMAEEIFGPVLTIYIYPDDRYREILRICDRTSPYALTGAVFATDRYAIQQAHQALRHAAGNFYVNDKPTGAVVGQQPFGGSRKSGTNDKAGSVLNMLKWVTPRTIKENFNPPTQVAYPHMKGE